MTEVQQQTSPSQRRPRRNRRSSSSEALVANPPELQTSSSPRFAHPSEEEFARILDFYGIRWVYEPRSFPLRWEDTRILEMFTPDFYLPDFDFYVELTTLRQSLVTEKNRKLRHMRELYPEVEVKLLYKRDYQRLLAKYGFGPLAEVEIRGIDRVLITTQQLRERVSELGREISEEYAGKQPVLIGVLRGMLCFMADLMREVSLPVSVDVMAVSSYSPNGTEGSKSVRITKDLEGDIAGQDVIMVEDIVDTGMTLNYLLRYLWSRNPASVAVCTLLDKRVRRLANVPLRYVGFEIPDEFVVGYGLDYQERYRNLPFIGVLKPEVRSERREARPRKKRSPK